jgi:hypothetical protein
MSGVRMVQLVLKVVQDVGEFKNLPLSQSTKIDHITGRNRNKLMELVYSIDFAVKEEFGVDCKTDFKFVKSCSSMSLGSLAQEFARRAGLGKLADSDWSPNANSPVSTYVERRSGTVFKMSIERAVSLVESPAFWAISLGGSSFLFDYITVSEDPRSWEIYGGGDFTDKSANTLWVRTPNGGSRVENFGLNSNSNVALSYSRRLLERISYNDWGFILRAQKNALIEVSTSFTADSFVIRGSQVRSNLPSGRDLSFQIDIRREQDGVSIQSSGGAPDFEVFRKLLDRCHATHESENFFRDLLETA